MSCVQYIPRLRRNCRRRAQIGQKKCFQHQAHRFPRPAYCEICLGKISKTSLPLSPCQHWVCFECVVKSGQNKCPLCRAVIKIPSRHMILFKFYAKSFQKHIQRESLRDYLEGAEDEEGGVYDFLRDGFGLNEDGVSSSEISDLL